MHYLAQLDAATKLIDHAAEQARLDASWFPMAVVVFMSVAMVWKAKRDERRTDEMAKRLDEVQNQHTVYLETKHQEMVRVMGDTAAALLQFAHALAPLTRILEGRANHQRNLP